MSGSTIFYSGYSVNYSFLNPILFISVIFRQERRDGSSLVSYRVSLPGVYTCSLKFNDEHIPFSPFRIYVADSSQMSRIASYTLNSQYSGTRELSAVDETQSQVNYLFSFFTSCLSSVVTSHGSIHTIPPSL